MLTVYELGSKCSHRVCNNLFFRLDEILKNESKQELVQEKTVL